MSRQFLEMLLKCPENKALYINEAHYSYKQLAKIVGYVYDLIPKKEVHKNIGIYCNDDVYTYASILAVNLYGAAYVPLNNKFPSVKNKTIIEQCDLKLVLSSTENEQSSSFSNNVELVHTMVSDSELGMYKKFDCPQMVDQEYSYILFTSGSTGEPKGVAVSDKSLEILFRQFNTQFDFTEKDKFLQASELTFDFSVFSFFMPLHLGACCYVVPDSGIKYVKIIQMLKAFDITVLSIVPTILKYIEKYLDEIKLPQLRYTFFSGDTLYVDMAIKWSKVGNGKIFNCYGTTESAVVCTTYLFHEHTIRESENGLVPLGKPFPSMNIRIVDENNNIANKGELSLNGDQVISSYLQNRDTNKFYLVEDKIYYKPGDIVSKNEKGDLIFHGRRDTQVKINGFRVELIEIEFAIGKIVGVAAVVLCVKDEKQLNILVAYVESEKVDFEALKLDLVKILPEYMIPQKWIAVEKFSLSVNGKIDKNKLLNLQK